jgi:hypothetical protein
MTPAREESMLRVFGLKTPTYDNGIAKYNMGEGNYLPLCSCPSRTVHLDNGCHWCNPAKIVVRLEKEAIKRKEENIKYVGSGEPRDRTNHYALSTPKSHIEGAN